MGHGVVPDSSLLDDFARRHGAPCPADADRFDWSVDALDDLARLVAAVAPAVTAISGCESRPVDRGVEDLVTAIVAHRNSLLRPEVVTHQVA
jgi:hypothetical protein